MEKHDLESCGEHDLEHLGTLNKQAVSIYYFVGIRTDPVAKHLTSIPFSCAHANMHCVLAN